MVTIRSSISSSICDNELLLLNKKKIYLKQECPMYLEILSKSLLKSGNQEDTSIL